MQDLPLDLLRDERLFVVLGLLLLGLALYGSGLWLVLDSLLDLELTGLKSPHNSCWTPNWLPTVVGLSLLGLPALLGLDRTLLTLVALGLRQT